MCEVQETEFYIHHEVNVVCERKCSVCSSVSDVPPCVCHVRIVAMGEPSSPCTLCVCLCTCAQAEWDDEEPVWADFTSVQGGQDKQVYARLVCSPPYLTC